MTRRLVPLVIVIAVAGIAAAGVRATSHGTPRTNRSNGFTTVLHARDYVLRLSVTPNRATAHGMVSVRLLRNGKAVNGARIKLTFSMLDMPMAALSGLLPQTKAGTYAHTGPVLGMAGHWGLHLDVSPNGAKPFSVDAVDRIAS